MSEYNRYSSTSSYDPGSLLARFISTLIGLTIYYVCTDLVSAAYQPFKRKFYALIWKFTKKKRDKRLQDEAEINTHTDF